MVSLLLVEMFRVKRILWFDKNMNALRDKCYEKSIIKLTQCPRHLRQDLSTSSSFTENLGVKKCWAQHGASPAAVEREPY